MAILEPLQTACALLLMGYMLYVTFFDASLFAAILPFEAES